MDAVPLCVPRHDLQLVDASLAPANQLNNMYSGLEPSCNRQYENLMFCLSRRFKKLEAAQAELDEINKQSASCVRTVPLLPIADLSSNWH